MLTNQFPPHMVKEVVRVFLGELPKRPKFVKHLFQFVSAADNIKTYTFCQLPPIEIGGLYVASCYRTRYVWVVDSTPGSMRCTSLSHSHAIFVAATTSALF